MDGNDKVAIPSIPITVIPLFIRNITINCFCSVQVLWYDRWGTERRTKRLIVGAPSFFKGVPQLLTRDVLFSAVMGGAYIALSVTVERTCIRYYQSL